MHGSMRRGLETEQTWPRSLGWHSRPGNRRTMKAPGPTVSEPPRQPRPYTPLLIRPAGSLVAPLHRFWRRTVMFGHEQPGQVVVAQVGTAFVGACGNAGRRERCDTA